MAYYGAAYDGALGVLGATGPDAMADRLALQAAAYAPYGKPVLTCFELITTVANATAGSDGMYSSRGKPDMVAEYLAAARRHKSLLLLDLQPGRADFLDQLKTYEQFLKEPEVGVALDAEWRTPDSRPGKTLGTPAPLRSTPWATTSPASPRGTTCRRSCSSCTNSGRL